MFYIFEILAGKESSAEQDYKSISYFDLEWSKLESWYFDNHILR